MNLLTAVEQKNIAEANRLLKQGVDINMTNKYGYSALHIASTAMLNEMAVLLIESGANPNIQDKHGRTILHYAALNNQLDIAVVALARGASLSVEDAYGNQPLWTAVFNDKGRNGRIDIVRLFIRNGADVNHRNKAGKSPRDIVEIAGYANLKSLVS
ncbi:ankyrin repeat domain-containing protein [Chitinophaga terrae (ex Kim and Jung 2007)]|uniref:ankyrin repeat domain-containing protein n=1 Tax=Chitinophaga terrae (ex Kim and Jung 2007) TaxID=408074 RepID=UPI0027D864AD|nr:ankyrin repeat domain-containing protein [Chitinophaga terrae (ex Kim and Jung 2007)]